MVHRYSSTRRKNNMGPLVAFMLIASFGILFAGCKGPESVDENQDFVFTQENADQAHQLAENAGSGALQTGTGTTPYLAPIDNGTGSTTDTAVLDLSMVNTYKSIREGQATGGKDVYHVTNEFLNLRDKPATTGANVVRLNFGDSVEVLSFVNAGWAQVKAATGQTGYVATRYIAKMTSDEDLPGEKKKFEGQYYVSYAFVNVRASADQKSEKIGEIPGQTIVKPTSMTKEWAGVMVDGKPGFVATSYLTPFKPNFMVRQNTYTMPVLHYQLTKGQEADILKALASHVALLKQQGKTFITFARFGDLLLQQQKQDTRIGDNNVIIALTGVTPDNVRAVSDALNTAGVSATLFIETHNIGLSGITQKTLLTLLANGFDIESATHTGDDLRALTNAQMDLELKESRKIIEDMTSKPVIAIAYPSSGSNDRVMDLASADGYLLGLGTGSNATFTRDQLLTIPGIDIFPNMTADEVSKLVTPK